MPVWMMLYGTGVYTAGLFSIRPPRVLGLTFIVMGVVALLAFPQFGIVSAALSFGIQTYISSSGRAYELAKRWQQRGAKVVLGGLHPTSLPDEAWQHADAIPENMRGNNKPVNATTDYALACRRFHDAGIMINGSFVFGFDHDDADVFDRTVEFTIENKILTATFHVLTPLPGTPAFARLDSEGRILHRNWAYYDTDHAVFRPSRMTPEELEEGLYVIN